MKRMARLSTDFWVGAYVRRLGIAGIPAFVVARGNSEAGSVLVRSNTLDGKSRIYQKSFDLKREREVWVLMDEGGNPAMDEMLERQRGRGQGPLDNEVEDREGRTLLEGEGTE